MALDPSNPQLEATLARLNRAVFMRESHGAARAYEEILSLQKDFRLNPSLQYDLARLLELGNEPKLALQAYQTLITHMAEHPALPAALKSAGHLAYRLKNHGDCRTFLERFLATSPTVPDRRDAEELLRRLPDGKGVPKEPAAASAAKAPTAAKAAPTSSMVEDAAFVLDLPVAQDDPEASAISGAAFSAPDQEEEEDAAPELRLELAEETKVSPQRRISPPPPSQTPSHDEVEVELPPTAQAPRRSTGSAVKKSAALDAPPSSKPGRRETPLEPMQGFFDPVQPLDGAAAPPLPTDSGSDLWGTAKKPDPVSQTAVRKDLMPPIKPRASDAKKEAPAAKAPAKAPVKASPSLPSWEEEAVRNLASRGAKSHTLEPVADDEEEVSSWGDKAADESPADRLRRLASAEFALLLPPGQKIRMDCVAEALMDAENLSEADAKLAIVHRKGLLMDHLTLDDLREVWAKIRECPQPLLVVAVDRPLRPQKRLDVLGAEILGPGLKMTTLRGLKKARWEHVRLISTGRLDREPAVDIFCHLPCRHYRFRAGQFNVRTLGPEYLVDERDPFTPWRRFLETLLEHCPHATQAHTVQNLFNGRSDKPQKFTSDREFALYNQWLLFAHHAETVDPDELFQVQEEAEAASEW